MCKADIKAAVIEMKRTGLDDVTIACRFESTCLSPSESDQCPRCIAYDTLLGSECERDARGGHDPDCSRYVRRVCKCSHLAEDHDEEGFCDLCKCWPLTVAAS